MKLQGSLAYILLALCLGSGEAGPLLSGGKNTGPSYWMGDTTGQEAGEAMGPGAGNAFHMEEAVNNGIGKAGQALENAGKQAQDIEDIIHQGIDTADSYEQGHSDSDSARATNGQPQSGGHDTSGSHSSLSGRGQGHSGVSFETTSGRQGGHEGSSNSGTNSWETVAQPGYDSTGSHGSNQNIACTNPQPSGSGGSGSGGSGSGGSGSGGSGSGSSGSSSNSGGRTTSSQGSSSSSSGGHSGSSGSSGDRPSNDPRNHGQGGSSGSQGSRPSSHYSGGSSSSSSSGHGGGHKPECDNPENEVRISGGSGGQGSSGQRGQSDSRGKEVSQGGSHYLGNSHGNYQGQGSSRESGRGEVATGVSTSTSEMYPGAFNFENFWKNLKSKLGFINWDAINQGQVPTPGTRALLYFSRLWEDLSFFLQDFKHNTPFFNWKSITEGPDMSPPQKRATGANQNYNYNQQPYPTAYGKGPAKGEVTLPSSASRAQPSLLRWMKFW